MWLQKTYSLLATKDDDVEDEISAEIEFYQKCIEYIKQDNYEEIFTLLAAKLSQDQWIDDKESNTDTRDSGKEQQFVLYSVLQFSKSIPVNIVAVQNKSITLLHFSCQNGAVNTMSKLLGMLSLLKENQYNIIHPLFKSDSTNHNDIKQNIEVNRRQIQNIQTEMKDPKEIEAADIQDIQRLTPYDILMKFIIGCQDKEGNLPFHILAKSNDARCTDILMQLFKEMNSYNDFDHLDNKLRGKSKLKHNYFHNDHNKYIDMQNMQGLTPLHLACIYGCLSNVTLLLQEGANRWTKAKTSNNSLFSSSWEGMNALHLTVLHTPSSMTTLTGLEGDLNNNNHHHNNNWRKENDLTDLLPIPFVDKEWSSPYHCIIDHLVSKSEFNNDQNSSTAAFVDSSFMNKRINLMQANDYSNLKNRKPSFSSYSLAEVEYLEGSPDSIDGENRRQFYIDSQNQRGQTSLHLAALTGKTDLVKIFLQKYKANGSITDFLREANPLHYALYALEIETNKNDCHLYDSVSSIVKLLVESSLDLFWQSDVDGIHPLHLACYYRHDYLINTFVDIITQSNSQNLTLSSIVDKNNLTVLHYLLKRGTSAFNVNFQTSIDTIFEALFSNRTTTSSRSRKEQISSLNMRSPFSSLQLFVEKKKMNINTQDENGFSALHYICNSDHPTDNITVLTYLLINGADIEGRSSPFGLTPLHVACITGNTSKTAALINQGTYIDIETFPAYEENNTVSRPIEESPIMQLFKYKDPKETVTENNIQLVSLVPDIVRFWDQMKHILRIHNLYSIVFGKAGQRFSSDGCFTPLHLSCIFGHVDTSEYLIFKGAAINAKTYNYQSPLHLSVLFRNIDCVRMLLHRNAQISHFFPISWDLRSFFHHPIFAPLFWKLEDIFPLHLLIQEDKATTFVSKYDTHRKEHKSLTLKNYLLNGLSLQSISENNQKEQNEKSIQKLTLTSKKNGIINHLLCTWLLFGQKGYNRKGKVENMEELESLNSKKNVTTASNIPMAHYEGIQRTHRRKGKRLFHLREKYSRYRSNIPQSSFPSMKSILSNVGNLSNIFFTDCHIISLLLSNQFFRAKQRVGRYIFENLGNVNFMVTIYLTSLTQAVNKYWQTSSSSLS